MAHQLCRALITLDVSLQVCGFVQPLSVFRTGAVDVPREGHHYCVVFLSMS